MNAVSPLPYARQLAVDECAYHADPCEVPSLSSSIAHILVSKSPRHAWAAHPKLGKLLEPEHETTAVQDGTLIHTLLLGKGAQIEVVDAKDWRTNAAKDQRDDAVKAGRVAVLRHRYDELALVAAELRTQILRLGFSLEGDAEVAYEWDEDGATGPVRCRGMMDLVQVEDGGRLIRILDLKKTASAHPNAISRHFYDYGHDIQFSAYTSCLKRLHPDAQVRMEFLFLEIDPPYAVTPAAPGVAFEQIGQQRWQRAIEIWERCLNTGRWPSYADSVQWIEPQPYVLNLEIGSGSW